MKPAVMDWNNDRNTELKEWAAAGKSRSWIANEYTARGMPCTRNMVVGRMWRMGLEGPRKQGDTGKKIARIKKALEQKEKAEARLAKLQDRKPSRQLRDMTEPTPLLIPTSALEQHHCRDWTGFTSDDCEPLYCGHTITKTSWCEYHHAKYLTPYRRKR